MTRFVVFVWALMVASAATSATRVAFLELRRADGSVIVLEDGFPFAHVAVAVDDGWVHASPKRGVEWVDDEGLSAVGRVAFVVDSAVDSFDDAALVRMMGRPFDFRYDWSDERVYCSELVAKLIGMAPLTLEFDPRYWPSSYASMNGAPGVSPGALYRYLTRGSWSDRVDYSHMMSGRWSE